jgi:hypothetical protein
VYPRIYPNNHASIIFRPQRIEKNGIELHLFNRYT